MTIVSPHHDTPDRFLERDVRQVAARERLRQQRHQLTNARRAERVMSLVAYYSARPLLRVPVVELLGRRWVA